MIDFHSHILPFMDDGAHDIQMSLEMLRQSYAQGVRGVVATSHGRAIKREELNGYIEQRQKSYDALTAAIRSAEEPLPKLYLGCELSLNTEILQTESISSLCIADTNYLLVEMPYTPWTTQHFESLDALSTKYRIILAHLERFMDHKQHFATLLDFDPICQINSASMLAPKAAKDVEFLFRNEMVQLIGTDMHNLTHRPPNLGKAADKIKKIYGADCLAHLNENAEAILQNQSVSFRKFKPKTIFNMFHK